MSLLVASYPDDKEKYIGLNLIACALGIITGPVFGGFLFTLGGFPTPFLVSAFSLLAIVPSTLKSMTEAESKVVKDDGL